MVQDQQHREIRVRRGRLICPVCGQTMTQAILPETAAVSLPCYCRKCKSTTVVDVIPEVRRADPSDL